MLIPLYAVVVALATFFAAIGCTPAMFVLIGIGVLLVFARELRAGLRKLRRPAVKQQPQQA